MEDTQKVMRRIEMLAGISDEPPGITRLFGSPAMGRANSLVAGWMRDAGMTTHTDAIGNLIGQRPGARRGAKSLLLGSHLDTVRNAGKFDGPLGVLLAIACVENLNSRNVSLPFSIQVIAFADEEGARYQTACLGSKTLAGAFDVRDLERMDADGISLRDAIKSFGGNPEKLASARLRPRNLLGFLEAHIEQGPVLERENLPVGIVSAIAGQTRCKISFTGSAGHAGATPMRLRRDALCAAAEFILTAEKLARETSGLVATVGRVLAEPGVSNVIPGAASLTLDVRHQRDLARKKACAGLRARARDIAQKRKLRLDWRLAHETDAVQCCPRFSKLLERAAEKYAPRALWLCSGAGHDAGIMSAITPAAMLFIRCKNGLSHHPDESARQSDARVALAVMIDFIQQLAQRE